MDTIDDNELVFPDESFIEIQTMSGWMTFTAVITILIAIISLFMDFGSLKSEASALISFLSSCFSLFIGFLLIIKANAFKLFVQTKTEEDLKKALKHCRNYFMLSAISMVISILISIPKIF